MYGALLVLALVAQPKPVVSVPPQIGYVYPPGAQAGQTVDVMIGGYDWTPDVRLFVRHDKVKIEFTGDAGEILMTPPPYWFGNKAGQEQPKLPRERPARITIPADLPPGPVSFQVHNASGASNAMAFHVGSVPEVIEPERHLGPIELPSLPAVANGRLTRITEIDEYGFTATAPGLITCKLEDRVGQPFNGAFKVRDAHGNVLVDGADTLGTGLELSFVAEAGKKYVVAVQDHEFAGDRGYVYRLSLTPGPRAVTTIPLVVARGKSTPVTVVGWGVKTGAQQLETVEATISVPADAGETHHAEIKTSAGPTQIEVAVADAADALASKTSKLSVPSQLTGVFTELDAASQMPLAKFQIDAVKGELRRLKVEVGRFGSPVDPSIAVFGPDGAEIIRNDDLAGSLDAAVDFNPPADGTYDVVVIDYSGAAPSPANVYRLTVEDPAATFDFTITAPDKFEIYLGDTTDMIVKSSKSGTWDEPIELSLEKLPDGITLPPPPAPEAPPEAAKPGKKPVKKPAVRKPKVLPGDVKLSIISAADAAADGTPVIVVAKATVGDKTITKRSEPVLLVKKMKPRCVVKSAVQDGGRLVNRGTTYPAEVIVERLESYEGPVTLMQASGQSRQRRGMTSPSFVVAQGVERVLYPIVMPEWLETNLTARMTLIGVVETVDPKGNKVFVTGSMDGNVVMSIEGGILKTTHEPQERRVRLGDEITVPIKVSRTVKCKSPATVEIVPDEDFPQLFTGEAVTLDVTHPTAALKIRVANEAAAAGVRNVTIRATSLQDGKWPAVSETVVPLVLEADDATASK